MGKKQTHLEDILAATIHFPYNEEIMRVYKALGGRLSDYPKSFGAWDIFVPKSAENDDGFYVELDENQHFNRYRGITLNSCVYKRERIFSPEQLEEYKRFCAEYEHRCPHTGGWWSNPSTNEQFGPASPEGDFSENGSSRWKQRAFYDFLKDVSSLAEEKPLIRVSVYDAVCVNGEWKPVGALLNSCWYMDYKQEILTLIEKRLEWKKRCGR